MNSMIQRVQTMFDEQTRNIEELRRTAYKDELTGLANSRATHAQLSNKLDNRDDEGPCTLFYLHITDLSALNEKLGEENASNLIKQISVKLKKLSENHLGSIVGRISGADMALLIANTDDQTTRRETSALLDECREIFDFYDFEPASKIPLHIATVASDDDTSAAQILSVARVGIEDAISSNSSSVHKTLKDTLTEAEAADWKTHVADAINAKKLFLQYQEVIECASDKVLQKELLVRILNQAGEPCAAVRFIRIVKELGLIDALDRAVIEHAIKHLNSHSTSEPLTVNISQDTLHAEGFDSWLIQTIDNDGIAGKLNIEMNESSILNDVNRVVGFKQLLNSKGIGFGVDNFGIHPSGFSYLYKVHPDYIKIDGSLCQEIDTNAEDRFFTGSLVTVANSLSIPSYAERVERTEQIEQLQKLGIVATQGFIHGQPKNLR